MKYVSFDLEGCLIDAGLLNPPVVCAQFCDESMQPELLDHMNAEQAIADMLACEDVTIIGANVAFDFGCVISEYPALLKPVFAAYRAGRILDVQLAQRLIDIAHGELDGTYNHLGVYVKYYYSLAALHERWGLGSLQKEGTWRLRYGELRGKRIAEYPAEAISYALDDATATLKVWNHQSEAYPHLLKDLASQTRAAFALHLMAIRGVHTDAIACDEYLAEVHDEIEGYKRLLEANNILRPNGTKDTKAAQAYMAAACAAAGITPRETDASRPGAVKLSLDAEATRELNDPVMLAYSGFTSAKGTVTRVEKLKLGSGKVPLQTRFTSLINNGRSASSEPSAPLVGANLQNLPRGGKARQCFKPRDGYVFCSVDFTGAELCTFAQVEKWLTGKSLIGDALNNKIDMHCYLGAEILGCTYEEVLANKKVGKYKWARQIAKAANFGLQGGMGAQRFMDAVNKTASKPEDKINFDVAQTVRDLWYETWQTKPYFDYINSLFADGELASMEHFISERVRGKVDFKEAANGFFSNLSADAFKAANWDLHEECYTDESSVLFGTRPVLPIHDEIIAEIPTTFGVKRVHDAAFRQAELMCESYNRYTPDYPVRAEPALMRVWLKAAEPAYDADGLLRPWTPQLDDPEFKPEKYLKRALELCAA